jgi:flagellar basal-body rod protein FlgG
MIKGFYTAKASIIERQKYTNSIANNIANVNTVGFKKNDVNFEEILSNQVREEYPDFSTTDYLLGGGAKMGSVSKDFSQGSLIQTDNSLDIALDGNGFMTLMDSQGQIYYTRGGSFNLTRAQYGSLNITDEQGYALVNGNMQRIQVPDDVSEIDISENGLITYQNRSGSQNLRIVNFAEDRNLEQVGPGVYQSNENANFDNDTKVRQGFLEMSNTDLAMEMVELITNQRLFGMNSKVIQTVDEMSNLANNLRR